MADQNKLEHLPRWRRTSGRPIIYWITGTILLWALLPLSFVDMVIALKWHAPHWRCDSLGIPLMYTYALLIPWTVMSAAIAALLTLPMTWRRTGGADILDLRLGRSLWKWIVTIPVAAFVAYVCLDLLRHVWVAVVLHTITEDCNGRADPITLEMHGPILQYLPICKIAIAIWLLHLRALALSPMHPAK